ncbi:hypothetical protein PV356_30765 [Streptomyces sp. WI03-5b]|uniref:hypothetical protein n=1 Tax=Streptomyces sp. WI03-5b TaxID=462946 RepID=UPI0029B3290B|nr:hypothetical protein [Streptomyces sp. WI03-5b]MDX2623842.1 hypothetical protein [Streptomyces sp. WI03-5b]
MDRWDVLVLLGVVVTGTGLFLLAPWLGVTVAGVVLLAVGVAGAHGANRTPDDQLQKGA